MSGHNYLSDPKNPFFSLEDDVDDETFLKSAPPRYPTASGYNANSNYKDMDDELQHKKQDLLQRRREIEERTLKSSQRSVNVLRDTEDLGCSTAEELIRQREQLERTDKRLDDINNTLRFSQKHITGIKSVFGGLKNYFSGNKSMDQPPGSSAGGLKSPESPMSPTSSFNLANKLNSPNDNTTDYARSNYDHPTFRLREEEDFESDSAKNMAVVLEKNLDEMSGSIARLKGLAIGLSEEIDTQNDLIDNITDKAERADITLGRQNKDIRNLLKK